MCIQKPSCSSRKVGVSEGTNSKENPDEQHQPQEPRSKLERQQLFLGARIDEQEVFPETRGHLCLCITAELRLGSRSRESNPPTRMLHEPSSAPAPTGQLCWRGHQTHRCVLGGSELLQAKLAPAVAWPLPMPLPQAGDLHSSRSLCTQPDSTDQKKSNHSDLPSLTLNALKEHTLHFSKHSSRNRRNAEVGLVSTLFSLLTYTK